jgi:hypothetical protein
MHSAPQPLTLTVITSTWEEFYRIKEEQIQESIKIWRETGVYPNRRIKLMTPDGEPG